VTCAPMPHLLARIVLIRTRRPRALSPSDCTAEPPQLSHDCYCDFRLVCHHPVIGSRTSPAVVGVFDILRGKAMPMSKPYRQSAHVVADHIHGEKGISETPLHIRAGKPTATTAFSTVPVVPPTVITFADVDDVLETG